MSSLVATRMREALTQVSTVKEQSHETLISFRRTKVTSNRKFGFLIGGIVSGLAIFSELRHPAPVHRWIMAGGIILILLAAVAPRYLAPLNLAWFRLGELLARVTNPIVMGIMYFGAVVPIAWLVRLRGHDLLRLRRDPQRESYWIPREDSAATSLTRQF